MKTPPPCKPKKKHEPSEWASWNPGTIDPAKEDELVELGMAASTPPDIFESVRRKMDENETEGGPSKRTGGALYRLNAIIPSKKTDLAPPDLNEADQAAAHEFFEEFLGPCPSTLPDENLPSKKGPSK